MSTFFDVFPSSKSAPTCTNWQSCLYNFQPLSSYKLRGHAEVYLFTPKCMGEIVFCNPSNDTFNNLSNFNLILNAMLHKSKLVVADRRHPGSTALTTNSKSLAAKMLNNHFLEGHKRFNKRLKQFHAVSKTHNEVFVFISVYLFFEYIFKLLLYP